MGVTTYYTVGGEIIGERSGGVRMDYLRDALGSVTATNFTDREKSKTNGCSMESVVRRRDLVKVTMAG